MFSAQKGSSVSLMHRLKEKGVEVGVVGGCVEHPNVMQKTHVDLDHTIVAMHRYCREKPKF